jgi:hypothetical protein
MKQQKPDAESVHVETLVMLREPLQNFVKAMEAKLKKNDHKGGWEDCFVDGYLFQRLQDEMEELEKALERNDGPALMDECVDVANFAMMIYDILAKRIAT